MGLDSLNLVELVIAIRKEWSIELKLARLDPYSTVDDLAALVEEMSDGVAGRSRADMRALISGTGSALPQRVVDNDHFVSLAITGERIVRRLGIHRR
ncbi:phosphopantetheine-binding protein [Streptomyces sp. P1-3]|uniref:acyl carrier protein n=1 Tax=Streptomyces sp. P1-3 TaxID=3421658 RepID=UPI003D367156